MSFAKTLGIVIALAVMATAGVVWADTIAVPQGNFPTTTGWTGAVPGWSFSGGAAWPGWQVYPSGGGAGTSLTGDNILSMYPGGDYGAGSSPKLESTVYTTTSAAFPVTLVSGDMYSAVAEVGQALNSGYTTASGAPVFTVTLLDAGSPVATGTVAAGAPGAWSPISTANWTATSSGSANMSIAVSFTGYYNNGVWSTNNANLADVSITHTAAASPEPATLTILVTGLVGLLAYAWRRRRA